MEKFFKVKEHGSTVKTEVLAGITTFMAMAYILMVNANMFSELGVVSYNAIYIATAISAVVGTFLIAFLANLPLGLASGMGLNAFFVYTVCFTFGLSYANALILVLLDGVVFIILTLTGVRKMLFDAIPQCVRMAISAGIGLFIAFLGLQDAGIIVNGVHDLDDLLFRDGQRRDLRVDVDVHAEIFNDLPRAAAHALPVNQTVFQLDVAKEHIFRNAQRLGQLDFLMDNADAGTACLDGAVKAAGLAVQNDFALIRLVDTGQNLNQGGLACAVLADQTVDGAALNVDGDVIQRLDAGELFCDIL